MIVIVAPYSPIGVPDLPHLGAARKLEIVITLLGQLDDRLVLVNSAHNVTSRRKSIEVLKRKINDIEVTEVVPETYSRRFFGKAKNLFQLYDILDVIEGIGVPRLVWLYNGYAFEALFARLIRQRVDCPVILEFEDWHFSRNRGLNPKPYLDYLAWRWVMPMVSGVFAVNAELASRVKEYSVPVCLLPGIVPASLIQCGNIHRPFDEAEAGAIVGYFGALSTEKGVDILLEAVKQLPAGNRVVVSGTGPLESFVREIADRYPDRLTFYGVVTDSHLYELIGKCDVIVNPHRPIAEMHDGVFPFKVVEAIASGRLLLSTALPSAGLADILAGVMYYDGSARGLVEALRGAPSFYQMHEDNIGESTRLAVVRFSEGSVLKAIEWMMGPIGLCPVRS